MTAFPEKMLTMAKNVTEEFATFRDRMRVKSHLLKLDSQDAWERFDQQMGKIEHDLNRFATQIGDSKEELRLEAKLGLMEAKDRYQEMQHFIDELVQQTEKEAVPRIDEAKLQAHLAKLELDDYFTERLENFKKQWAKSKEEGLDELRGGLENLSKGVQKFLGRLSPDD